MEKKKLAILLEISENNDGYVSMDDLKMHSIERTYLSLAVEEGLFTRVGKGLYLRKGYEKDPYFLTHHTYKKAVIALRSATILWGLLPEKGGPLMLYLPTGYMTKGIEGAKC
ncbi:MAG: type IV toxin-antitoxin system AbiEi family antitoxin domain-containing protein, partial [Bacilli bacterium]|nr:type IV toxin-antitoxin system AbiEi family antitoxin domain-containing protein [Bacilli bacterium]